MNGSDSDADLHRESIIRPVRSVNRLCSMSEVEATVWGGEGV